MRDNVFSLAKARIERAMVQNAGAKNIHLTPEDVEIFLGIHNPEPHHHKDYCLRQESNTIPDQE